MTILWSTILSFLLMVFFFGFCVFIHEFGHLLAGLWRNLHIERFSIGFGPPIWKKEIKGVEYRVSWIPFGGYVALPQLEPTDEPETFDGEKLEHASPMDRIITAFAGPLFNVLFALFLACIVWAVGMKQPAPQTDFVVGEVKETYTNEEGEEIETPEHKAGLKAGDRVVSVNGKELAEGYMQARELIIISETKDVTLGIVRDGEKKKITYPLTSHPDPRFRGAPIPMFYPVTKTQVGKITDDSAAEKAGLQEGDILLEINGEEVQGQIWVLEKLAELNEDVSADKEPEAAEFKIVRRSPEAIRQGKVEGETMTITVKPQRKVIAAKRKFMIFATEEERWMFGMQPVELTYLAHPTPLDQFGKVVGMMGRTLSVIFNRDNPIGVDALSGPVGIAKFMHQGFSISFIAGLHVVMIISLSLAIFNLLPLPILDGGHITFALAEMIARRRVPARFLRPVFYFFFAILITFAVYVTWNDISKGFSNGNKKKTKEKIDDETRSPTESKEATPSEDSPGAAAPPGAAEPQPATNGSGK